jgi:hypothetical protein
MTPRDIERLHSDLTALLEAGQPPAIALLLRATFLRALPRDDALLWSAYGFDVARGLVEGALSIQPASLLAEGNGILGEVLRSVRARPIPPFRKVGDWERRIADACVRAERAERGAEADLADRGWGGEGGLSEAEWEGSGTVYIPVVARLNGGKGIHPLYRDLKAAYLVPLRVQAEGTLRSARGGEPMVEGVPAHRRDAFVRALGALEALRLKGAPRLAKCLFRIAWGEPNASLDGRSAELGFVAAAAAAYSSLSLDTTGRRIAPGIAFTGVVEGERVIPVGEGSLDRKVEACFHARMRLLVVPKVQEEAARAVARGLEVRYPGRRLVVAGASALGDVWRDHDVVEVGRRTAGEYVSAARRRFAMSRVFVVTTVLVLAAFIGYAAREAYVSDPNPVSAKWEGNRVIATNRHGRFVRVIGAGLIRPDVVEVPTWDPMGKRLALWDTDGDGTNEILVIYRSVPTRTDRMAVFDRSGRLRWVVEAETLGFPEGMPQEDLQWLAAYSTEERRNGSLLIIAMRRVPARALAFADVIDGATGALIASFRNNGHIEGMFAVDIGDDGIPEYCLSATDNETGMGLLGIIRVPELEDPEPRPSREIPALTEPQALNMGLVAAFHFPADAFSVSRAHAREVVEEAGDVLRVCVVGNGEGAIDQRCTQYWINLADLQRPILRDVQFTDSYLAIIRLIDPSIRPEELHEACERVSRGSLFLTPRGWQPIARSKA